MSEGLELLAFLDDRDAFLAVQTRLTPEALTALASTGFKHILYLPFSDDLVSALITHYLNVKKEQGLDALKHAGNLREKCPSYFTQRQFDVYKAGLLLERAGKLEGRSAQTNAAKEAISILMDNAAMLDLEQILPLLLSLEQYSAAKKVCLLAAAAMDRNEENEGGSQQQQQNVYKDMCYEYVMRMLGELHATLMRKSGVRAREEDAGLFAGAFVDLPVERLRGLEDTLIQEAVDESRDECFHLALFRWLADERMMDRLVRVRSPFLEQYLKNRLEDTSSKPSEFLYQYMIEKKEYRKACEMLYMIATGTSTETFEGRYITLEVRAEYLNTAISCIEQLLQSKKESQRERQELLDYRCSIETCKGALQRQIEILSRLGDMEHAHTGNKEETRRARTDLEAGLIDTQELYDNYAKRFELWDIAIHILTGIIREGAVPPRQEHIAALGDDYTLLLQKIYADSPQEWPQPAMLQLTELAKLYCPVLDWAGEESKASTTIAGEDEEERKDGLRFGRSKAESVGLFPITTVVRQAEAINVRHFEMKDVVGAEQPTEALTGRPEFWVLNFLQSIKQRFEDVFEIYENMYSEDAQDGKWNLRMEMAKLVTTLQWNQAIREGNYDQFTAEKCKACAKRAIRAANVFLPCY